MEYVDGTDMQQIVKQHGPLYGNSSGNGFAQAARGLQHAHNNGVIHPTQTHNLLIDKTGCPLFDDR